MSNFKFTENLSLYFFNFSIHLYLHLFSCSYDEEADKVNQYQRLNLEGLEKIEIGKKLDSKEK